MARRLFALVVVFLTATTIGLAGQAPQNTQPAAAAEPAAPAVMDFSGTWLGTIAIPEKGKRGKPSELQVVLKQNGATLTGSVGPTPNGPVPIINGRVNTTKYGTSLNFDVKGPTFVMEFQLKPNGSVLRGLARLSPVDVSAPVELHMAEAARTVTASAAFSPASSAPTVSGKWVGTFSVATAEMIAHMVFEQSGTKVTGTAGPTAHRQIPISNGKVETTSSGTTMSFQMDLASDDVVLLFDLKLTEAGLEGTVTATAKGEKAVGTAQLKPVR